MPTTEVIDHALRGLRHLYEQMLDGHVRPSEHDIANAARGLLGPAIESVERAQKAMADLQAERDHAVEQEKQTAATLDGFVGDLEKAHNAQVPTEIRCPKCDMLHVDQDEWATTRLHRKHLCHGCGNIWQPYSVTTTGCDFHAGCRETLNAALKLANPTRLSLPDGWTWELPSGLESAVKEYRALKEQNTALEVRRDELLAMVAKLSQTVPFESEVAEALEQRGALLAEIGTLKARIAELEGHGL